MNCFEKLALEQGRPLHILHGTDWWTDCDDIVALRLLCRAHKAGAIVLECVCADAVMEDTAASIDAFLMAEGLCIPVGLDKNAYSTGEKCRYQPVLARYPHRINSNDECEDAYRVYRRVLAGLDTKADITEIGFPQIIHQLLASPPDDISPLSGMELVREKVNKIWMMAGKWDVQGGREYNLINTPHSRAAGSFICNNSPVPVTFLGFEVGESVITGGGDADSDDLLRVGMAAHGSQKGRCSWDPMLTLLAIINDEKKAGYKKVCGTAEVDEKTGRNYFSQGTGTHAYVVKAMADSYYENEINKLI